MSTFVDIVLHSLQKDSFCAQPQGVMHIVAVVTSYRLVLGGPILALVAQMCLELVGFHFWLA